MTAAFCRRPSGDAPDVLWPTEEQREAYISGARGLLAALRGAPEPNELRGAALPVGERAMPYSGPAAHCTGISITCVQVGDADIAEARDQYAHMRG